MKASRTWRSKRLRTDLDQHRLDGVVLTCAFRPNLGRDHMDYHATEDAYLNAKLRLFTELLEPGQSAVINTDAHARAMLPWPRKRRGFVC